MSKVIMIAGDSTSTKIVYHALSKVYMIDHVIIEESVSRKQFLKNRAKKLGWLVVFGQVMFAAIIPKWLTLLSKKRIQQILSQNNLRTDAIPQEKITRVTSVNSNEAREIILNINPTIIVVNGTRIISSKLLSAVPATFINMHAGITPYYRGVHGGYWSLVEHDGDNFGTTIHLVDKGVDTGNVIFQNTTTPQSSDNFVTYPYLQIAAGLPSMIRAVGEGLSRKLVTKGKEGEGKQWYHPTLWSYLYYCVFKGVK